MITRINFRTLTNHTSAIRDEYLLRLTNKLVNKKRCIIAKWHNVSVNLNDQDSLMS